MRITRKMRRELKKAVNPLRELLIIIKQYFPKFFDLLDNLTDTRNQSYITYDLKIWLIVRILALCSGIQSMNSIGRDFSTDETIENINQILKENYVELPHKDTLTNIVNELKYEELENIQTYMIRSLIRSKMLDKYRYNGMFHVVIDGTRLYSTSINLGENAITRVYNEGTDGEYKLYSYYVLEAKIICGDALYMGKPFLKKCDECGFEYIIRYKEDAASTIKKDFDKFNIVDGDYKYQNGIIYGEPDNKNYYTVNVIGYNELDEESGKITNFSYITSLEITSKNKEARLKLGRKRWKIENKGFREQKSGVLNISHIYTKDCNGTKNTYLLIQFTHTLLNLLYYGNVLIKVLKEVSALIRKALTSNTHTLNINKNIQLRLL